MTRRGRHSLAALSAAGALALAGCGSSDEPEGEPLPTASVEQLERRLDEIERRYQDAVDNGNVGACDDIGDDSLPAIQEVIDGLPPSVDPELRTAVERSFDRLRELTESECADVEPAPEPEPIPEPVPLPAPPETETEPEPEEEPEEEEAPEELPEETLPPQNNRNGNGNGNGGGVEVPPGLDGND